MNRNQSRFDAAVETLTNYGNLSESEAHAFIVREFENRSRADAAEYLEIELSTLDTLHQRAKSKVTLPGIDEVVRVSERNTGTDEGRAWEIRFKNGALLRYVWNHEREEIVESVNRADDPVSTYKQFGVGGTEDDLEEYALESISEYTRNYRDDYEACRADWTPVYEALTGYGA